MIIKYSKFLNENQKIKPNPISIEDFVNRIGLSDDMEENVIDWWKTNRSRIKIQYFPFNTTQSIMGCFLDENTVAINSTLRIPSEVALFIALHESYHADQHLEGRFMEPYFHSVKNDDRETFLSAYKQLEKESNDFATESMLDMGFDQFVRMMVPMLRRNEYNGTQVWDMMKKDIDEYQSNDMFELLASQIY